MSRRFEIRRPPPAAPTTVASMPATALTATPVWGSALSFSPPVDLLFRLGAYTPAWKFRGAAGGASLDGDASGARSFAIDMSGNTGDNIAAGALRLDGRATFRASPDGDLDAKWVITPDRDGVLSEAMLETRIAIGRATGGFLLDGKALPVPESVAGKPHLFRGEVSRLADGPDKIDDIAFNCGYASSAAFSIFFRAETGLSPMEWRKTHRSGA